MPYIEQTRRKELDAQFFKGDWEPESEGELNYLITQLCLYYLEPLKQSYAGYNTVIGALECAKMEFYRRATAPYEDKKIASNGDVYGQ